MKPILSVFLTLLLCLSLFACGKQSEAPPANDPPAVDPPPVETPVQDPATPPEEEPAPVDPLPGETVAPEVPEVIVNELIVVSINADNEKTFQLDLNLPVCESLSSINNYYQAMRDDLQATYALNREDAARQLADYQAAGLEFQPWTAQVTATVTRNDGVTLSVLREVYENFGSPYPTVFYQAETFDVASQGRLVLGNLFTVNEEDAVKRLMDEVRAMALQTDSILWYEGVADRLEQLYDPLDFALTDDSLVVFFRDIAPHAAGVQRFEIPLSALSDILKPQWVN